MKKRVIAREWLLFVGLGLVLGLLWPMALFSALGGSPGEFFEALFDDDEALAAWGVALAPYALVQLVRSVVWAVRLLRKPPA